MKPFFLFMIALCLAPVSFSQDLTYTGPGKGEVHSFWLTAMAIKKTGKMEEGILKMEAKLAEIKQAAPNYNTTDMVAEIKKWKEKLAANSNPPLMPPAVTELVNTVTAPQSIVNIKDLVITNAAANYTGSAKMYVTNYYKQAQDAKTNIEKQAFPSAQTKIEQMEKSVNQIKTKDPSFNTGALEAEVKNFKAAMETEKYNIAKGAAEGESKAANEQVAYKVLGEVFGMQNLDFRSDEFALRAMIIQKHKASMESYLSLTTKATANALEGYKKKTADFFVTHTNMTLKKFETFIPTATGTDWVESIYYTIQYHQSFWNAAQKIYPAETEFATMYQKVTAMADKLGSIENMKGKGSANGVEAIKNRKLPDAVVKDAALEKLFMETYTKKLGAEVKGTAIKAIILQSDWKIFRNAVSGIVTGRSRQAAIVYKGTDGKCYLRMGIFLHQEYVGNNFGNSWVEDARLGGGEMLCSNVN